MSSSQQTDMGLCISSRVCPVPPHSPQACFCRFLGGTFQGLCRGSLVLLLLHAQNFTFPLGLSWSPEWEGVLISTFRGVCWVWKPTRYVLVKNPVLTKYMGLPVYGWGRHFVTVLLFLSWHNVAITSLCISVCADVCTCMSTRVCACTGSCVDEHRLWKPESSLGCCSLLLPTFVFWDKILNLFIYLFFILCFEFIGSEPHLVE